MIVNKNLLLSADVTWQCSASAVSKGFLKEANSHMNGILNGAEEDSSSQIFKYFTASLETYSWTISSFQKPFHDSTSGFNNRLYSK